ncbi:MAG: HAMP domain-containing histidine kinase [Clostridia bacterium]|nr:HAMP domain-containing histidine kinase [Clostridia bacterium]
MRRKNKVTGFLGVLFFFLTVSVIATVAILVYEATIKSYDGFAVTAIMSVTIFCLALMCTVADVFRRKIMVDAPLKKIIVAMERLGKGDFSVRVRPDHPFGKYSEYDVIMYYINAVAENLGKSEMLNADFISNVSHEIKTPLAIIENYATILKSDKLDDDTRKKYIGTLCGATRRLNSLVVNILKLNKLENSKIESAKEKINLTAMVSETIIAFEDVIERKDITVETDFDEVSVYSSASYLEVVFNNIVSNAVKFTDNGGKIKITVKSVNGKATVSVQDTGIGISKETGKHIFDKFYQGDTSHSKEGNGLGLALVKKVIDLIGGEISVESELGKGSTFTVALRNEVA